LLKVLSLFPQGESLSRIRYFYSTKPFFPLHASELRDQGLIDTVMTQRLDAEGEETSPKVLMVPHDEKTALIKHTYLQKLVSILGESISRRLARLSKEAAYYLVRVSSQLKERVASGDRAAI